MCSLTIHTATYNRAYILPAAYESLKKQTNKDFEWIITDDGSTDTTEKLVRQWMAEDPGFPIVYNKLSHVGIPRALNSGVCLANTPWFMMLDSDDHIEPDKEHIWPVFKKHPALYSAAGLALPADASDLSSDAVIGAGENFSCEGHADRGEAL